LGLLRGFVRNDKNLYAKRYTLYVILTAIHYSLTTNSIGESTNW